MVDTGLRYLDQILLNQIQQQNTRQEEDSSSDENEDYQMVPKYSPLPPPPSTKVSKMSEKKEEPTCSKIGHQFQQRRNPWSVKLDRGQGGGQESLTFFATPHQASSSSSSSSSETVQPVHFFEKRNRLTDSDHLNNNHHHSNPNILPVVPPPPPPSISTVSSQEIIMTSSPTPNLVSDPNPMSTEEAALLLTSLGRDQSQMEETTKIEMPSTMEVEASPRPTTTAPAPAKKVGKDPLTGVKLPLTLMQEFDQLERIINENDSLRSRLLYRLGTIGGKNYGQCARNGLKALMTDSLAVQFNWAGRGEKRPFQSTEIKSVLFDAVRLNFPKVTDYQLKDPVQCWLKRSRKLEDMKDLKSKKIQKILPTAASIA